MSILTMPTTPKFNRVTFSLRANTQAFEDSRSLTADMRALSGSRWSAQYELPPMKRDQAAAWCAFLAQCNGRIGRFYGYAPDAITARGTVAGTLLVNGAGQTGSSLNLDGASSGAATFLVGDYFAFDTPAAWRELHKVTADTGTVGSTLYGNGGYGDGVYGALEARVEFAPPLRESPDDNQALIVSSASCVMRLIDDEQAAWDIQAAMIYGMKFSAEEVWPTLRAPA